MSGKKDHNLDSLLTKKVIALLKIIDDPTKLREISQVAHTLAKEKEAGEPTNQLTIST
jgi:L-lactate utilization protein LutC